MKTRLKNFLILSLISISIFSGFQGLILLESQNPVQNRLRMSQGNYQTTLVWSYCLGSDKTMSITISADGDYIVALGADQKAYLFDNNPSSTKTPLWTFTHSALLQDVKMTPDGSYFFIGGYDGSVHYFHRSSSIPIWSNDIGSWIYSVDISSDGNYMVAGGRQTELLNSGSSTPQWSFNIGNTELYLDVDIDSAGEYLVSGANDGHFYLFHRSSGTPIWTFTKPSDESPSHVSISSDGNSIVAGLRENGNELYFFDRSSNVPLWNYSMSSETASLELSQDGKYIIAADNNYMYFFNSSNSTPLWTTYIGIANQPTSVATTHNGSLIAMETITGYLHLYTKDSSTPYWSYKLDGEVINNNKYPMAISSDGKYIAAKGDNCFYLFKNVPVSGGAGEQIIPFGNYYLIFLIISVIYIILISKMFKKSIQYAETKCK